VVNDESGSRQVVFGFPHWQISGVNVRTSHLIRRLRAGHWDARVLLTSDDLVGRDGPPADLPIDRLSPVSGQDRRMRWRLLREYLTRLGRCVYVPNYDWDCAAAIPSLDDTVRAVAVACSDEPVYYEGIGYLADHLDAVIAVSSQVGSNLRRRFPALADRIHVVFNGVPCPDAWRPPEVADGRPLRLLYSGRVVQYQKRVFDLPLIAQALLRDGIDFHLTVIGDGPDRNELIRRSQQLIQQGSMEVVSELSNREVLDHCDRADVFLLPSEFEGLSVSLMEAMSHGCVPVASATESGIPELVRDGVNGLLVPIGQVDGFADAIGRLDRDRALLRTTSRRAYESISGGPFRLDAMADGYRRVFEAVLSTPHSVRKHRRRRILRPVHAHKRTALDFLPDPVLSTYRRLRWR